jgi:L,D-transpeptidase ErfK/SrfK
MLCAMKTFKSLHDRRSWITATAVFWAVIYLSGCATFSDWRHAWARPEPAPVPSDRFPLPPEGTDIVGEIQVTTTVYEDTLVEIARRYDLGYEEIVAANPGVDPWLPGKDTQVVLPTQFVLPGGPREGLVLNLASMRLFYYPKLGPGESAVVVTHPIGIGREGWQTPQGTAHITQKIENPAWTVPESVRKEHAEQGDPLPPVVPPGPDNALGDFAMRLSIPSYLIHGTNKPYGVGLRVSHGCIRLYPEDIARLFPEVPVGTPVRIINEPYLAGWRDGQLYLEVHEPLAEDVKRWNGSLKPMEQVVAAKAGVLPVKVSWEKAGNIAREARGIPVPIATGSPDLAEMLAKASRVPSTPPWAAAGYEKAEPEQRTASANARATN